MTKFIYLIFDLSLHLPFLVQKVVPQSESDPSALGVAPLWWTTEDRGRRLLGSWAQPLRRPVRRRRGRQSYCLPPKLFSWWSRDTAHRGAAAVCPGRSAREPNAAAAARGRRWPALLLLVSAAARHWPHWRPRLCRGQQKPPPTATGPWLGGSGREQLSPMSREQSFAWPGTPPLPSSPTTLPSGRGWATRPPGPSIQPARQLT